ncbi:MULTISPECIES: hypothetical protein [Nocardia]|uniref:hypothetical protein n=1 Tax=Nocardia TaxID=1817 RepID=UPI000D69D9BB|nr:MULTISPECIES: hypothetical protein [Nocardia]
MPPLSVWGPDSTPDVVGRIGALLRDVAGDASGIDEVYAGPNLMSAQTHAVVVVVDDRVGLDEFDAHPLRGAVGTASPRSSPPRSA